MPDRTRSPPTDSPEVLPTILPMLCSSEICSPALRSRLNVSKSDALRRRAYSRHGAGKTLSTFRCCAIFSFPRCTAFCVTPARYGSSLARYRRGACPPSALVQRRKFTEKALHTMRIPPAPQRAYTLQTACVFNPSPSQRLRTETRARTFAFERGDQMPRAHICAAMLCATAILVAFTSARCAGGSDRTASPDAQATPQDLLPCPYSLPCIATARAYPAEHPADGASAPTNALLPCPDSAPCVVVGNPAMRESRPGDRIRPRAGLRRHPLRLLGLRIVDIPESAARPAPAQHAANGKPSENMAAVRYSAISQSPTSKASYASPVVTMENGASDREKAQEQIVQAERDLARIQRDTLSAQEAKTYEVARRFEREAEHAIHQNRYLLAVGLSRKASSLARNLAYQQEIGQRTAEATSALNALRAKLLGNSEPGLNPTSTRSPAP